MSDKTQNTGTMDSTDHIYFAALLPWQQNLWSQLTKRVLTSQQSLPHALLAAGMQGMGKRAFVWRLVAWLLCRERDSHPTGLRRVRKLPMAKIWHASKLTGIATDQYANQCRQY